MLAQDFHRDGALPGDHVRVVEGVHEGQALLALQVQGMLVGVRVALAMQHHLAAQAPHGIDLHLRCGDGHHDDGLAPQLARTQRHALRMVAGRRADHTALELRGRELGHLVVGAAQLEAEHRLGVLTLQQHLVAQPLRQGLGRLQRGLLGHVIDARIQHAAQVVVGGLLRHRGRGDGFLGGLAGGRRHRVGGGCRRGDDDKSVPRQQACGRQARISAGSA